MPNVTVVGAQWGDEGKGKIVDWLSEKADVIVRFQGGHNAGHTLVVDGVTYKLKLLPGTLETITKWDRKCYRIILTTGRREGARVEVIMSQSNTVAKFAKFLIPILVLNSEL